MRKITEAHIQRGVLDYLALVSKKIPMFYFRSASGQVITNSNRVFKTGTPGVQDITLLIKGKYIALEIKTPTGKQSELQRCCQKAVEAAGGVYHVVRSMQDIQNIIDNV